MANPKILIAAGCSFTQVPNTYKNWPIFLSEKLNLDPHYLGLSSSGNAIIARRALYEVHKCLAKDIKPEEMLVGIMWSGVNRHSFYLDQAPYNYDSFGIFPSDDNFQGNPCRVAGDKNFYNVIPTSTSHFGKTFYKNYHSLKGSIINTLEHMLRVQLYLKSKNIPYFFTEYADDCINGYKYGYNDTSSFKDPDITYIDEMIDYSCFLPVHNMESWNTYVSGLKYERQNDNHPTSQMSEAFVDKIMIPHLINKKLYEPS